MDTNPLPLLERYYDTAPRATARTEDLGPLTLFVAERGWPYYARPRLGLQDVVRREEVEAVLERQSALSVPRSLEWVHETTPSLEQAARSRDVRRPVPPAGARHPHGAGGPPGRVRIVDADDPDLAAVRAAIHDGFGAAGTASGPQSVAERDAALAGTSTSLDTTREAIRAGHSVQVGGVRRHGRAGGRRQPQPPWRGERDRRCRSASGVPAARAGRRGTALLARDAAERGVRTVFCSAESADVARIYEGIGFRRVGTACIAEMD